MDKSRFEVQKRPGKFRNGGSGSASGFDGQGCLRLGILACGDPQFQVIGSSLKPYLAEPDYMTHISQHFQSLGLAIEFARENHRVIGQNLANVNTPGYKTAELSFEDLLSKIETGAGQADNVENGGSINFETRESDGLQVRSDGNNVDMDREVARLKKNALAYQTLTQLLGSKMGMLQLAING